MQTTIAHLTCYVNYRNKSGKEIDYRINDNLEDENIKIWNRTLIAYEKAGTETPRELRLTLLYDLIQNGQIQIQKEYIDTEFETMSKETDSFRAMCQDILNLAQGNRKTNNEKNTWKLIRNI